MRIVYLGNNDRGVRCLEALLGAGHDIAGVVAHPDPAVRPWYGSVKETALAAGLPVIQPRRISTEAETIRRWRPELLVLAGYGRIIRRDILEIPVHGAVNLHGGKLPEYRGASVLNWTIINGESEGGVSILRVDEGVDTGDVLAEERFPIGPDDTIREVLARSLDVFPPMLVRVLEGMTAGTLETRRQDAEAGRTWPKRHPEDGLLHWQQLTAEGVHNMVRALTRPYPGAFSRLEGRKVFIWKSRLTGERADMPPGRVLRHDGDEWLVTCKDGSLVALTDVTDQTGEPLSLSVGTDLAGG